MTDARALQALMGELEQSLALLGDYRQGQGELSAEPLPSLLEQCQALCDTRPDPEGVRSIHHFACSGGTLITKCLGALPNVVTLSEVDPLSRMQATTPGRPLAFAPTDLIRGLRHAVRGVDEDMLVAVFTAGLRAAQERLSARGHYLLLRDHAHSQFCTFEDPESRPTLHDILQRGFALRSLVTVRHPLDSFLSLRSNGWIHFEPGTLEEYSRRYIRFLEHHAGVPLVKYEDFVADPAPVLEHMSRILELPFSPMALDILQVVPMSGDSGRAGGRIAPRPRRQLPPDLDAARHDSPAYADLCERLSYEV